MKILFAADVSIDRVGSGAERVLFEQTTRLSAAGHDVYLMTRAVPEIHQEEKTEISGVSQWYYQADKRHSIKFVMDTFINGRRLFKKLNQDMPFECLVFHQPLSACAVLYPGTSPVTKTLYVCHSLWHEEYLSRGGETTCFFKRLVVKVLALGRKRLERWALNRSDRIIALSAYTKEKLQRSHGIPGEKITIVPGGVDLERFRPDDDKPTIRQRLGLPVGGTILFTLRNLEPRMGIGALLKAMGEVKSLLSEVYLVIGGEGPLKEALVEQVDRSGLNAHVFFTGFINEADLPDYYRMADLFILPTLDLEGFGMVTLEALASGTPVLGTPVGGTREILEVFDPSFLFKDTSADAMAGLIMERSLEMISDPGLAASLQRKMRAFVEAHYSWDRHINALMSLAGVSGESHVK